VVVVASLNEATLDGYRIDFPWSGEWREVFNSDAYDHYPNPWIVGNGGAIRAEDRPGAMYPHTAQLRIPANGVLIFARGAD
jgi:1,4-alpha-glucan branching enzyme